MSATRTQIYLTAQQRSRIDELAASEGLTMAEVIRRALDAYLAEEHPDPAAALSQTFGTAPDLVTPTRDEWLRG
ncbi:MAG: CopG family transcriptional regulator [Ornithinimicrobium sp.]|uniref:ribbon-helix-helix domain-containing protein n=1 Tax=Ornithinimicrobium sp. TaxID=1977084 RepID=UPI003D9B2641